VLQQQQYAACGQEQCDAWFLGSSCSAALCWPCIYTLRTCIMPACCWQATPACRIFWKLWIAACTCASELCAVYAPTACHTLTEARCCFAHTHNMAVSGLVQHLPSAQVYLALAALAVHYPLHWKDISCRSTLAVSTYIRVRLRAAASSVCCIESVFI
jgi:hypothetical protein